MREIVDHKMNGLNEALNVAAADEPGVGGANHEYFIWAPLASSGDLAQVKNFLANIKFQNGPISEAGVNGISNEALLAIVFDRLMGFQKGIFACSTNQAAATLVKGAIATLHLRTLDRIERGVEGTHQV